VTATGDVARAIAVRAKASEHPQFAGAVEAMIRHVVTTQAEAVKGTELDPAQLRARRDKLIARAEDLLPKQAAAPVETDVAAQLKKAMQKNAFGDLRWSGRDPVEVIDELAASWAEAGPFFDDADRAQTAKFDATIARVLEAVGAPARRNASTSTSTSTSTGTGTSTGTSTGAAVVAAPESITQPNAIPVASHDAITAPAVVPRVKAPTLPPPSPAEAKVDAGWDLGEDDPTSAEPDKLPAEDPRPAHDADAAPSTTPSSSEMAGDGATEGDGLDSGWD
jgi:hypothetical protein